jgi:hypothetical protein
MSSGARTEWTECPEGMYPLGIGADGYPTGCVYIEVKTPVAVSIRGSGYSSGVFDGVMIGILIAVIVAFIFLVFSRHTAH